MLRWILHAPSVVEQPRFVGYDPWISPIARWVGFRSLIDMPRHWEEVLVLVVDVLAIHYGRPDRLVIH